VTRTEIEALEGRALDAAVAKLVMGYKKVVRGKDYPYWVGPVGFMVPPEPDEWYYYNTEFTTHTGVWSCMDYLPDLSITWQGMGMVIEAMEEKGWQASLAMTGIVPERRWQADFEPDAYDGHHRIRMCYGRSAPESVCRAALLALSEANDDPA
jgi:hypothetical protein